jgi:hypothetical protein
MKRWAVAPKCKSEEQGRIFHLFYTQRQNVGKQATFPFSLWTEQLYLL